MIVLRVSHGRYSPKNDISFEYVYIYVVHGFNQLAFTTIKYACLLEM